MAPRTITRTQDLTTARDDENILFNPCDVISAGSYGIAILRDAYCTEVQKNEPFVLFKAGTTVSIQGTADEVRTYPNMWHVSHLNARKAFNYLSKYKNIRNGEPNRKWKSTLHRGMSSGTVCMNQLQPIISLTEWNSRNEARIRSLEVKLAICLLQKVDATLASMEGDQPSLAQQVQQLEMQMDQSIDHRLETLCKSIRRQLIWRNRKRVFSNIYSTKFFTFITPDEWKRRILPIFNRFGGVQTGYKSTQETWKISGLQEEGSTQLLSPTNTPLIRVSGTRTYKVSNTTVHYSARTLKLKAAFTVTYTGGFRKGFRHRRV